MKFTVILKKEYVWLHILAPSKKMEIEYWEPIE